MAAAAGSKPTERCTKQISCHHEQRATYKQARTHAIAEPGLDGLGMGKTAVTADGKAQQVRLEQLCDPADETEGYKSPQVPPRVAFTTGSIVQTVTVYL